MSLNETNLKILKRLHLSRKRLLFIVEDTIIIKCIIVCLTMLSLKM